MIPFRNKLLFLGLSVAITAFSQGIKPSFNFNGAIALPQGDFKNKDIYNQKSGLAKPGFGYGFDLGFKFGTIPLGFAITYKRIENPVDFNSASSIAARNNPGVTYHLSTEPWKSRSFLMGIYGSLNFDSAGRFNISPRLLAGWMELTPFRLNLTFPQGYNGAYYYPLWNRQKDFAFLFGVNFRYVFLNSFYISMNADYLHTIIEFESYNLTTNGTANTITQPVNLVSLGLGLGVKW